MKTIKVFFEIGHFVTTLKSSLEEIGRSLKATETRVVGLEHQDLMTIQAISHLKQQMDTLDRRIGRLEEVMLNQSLAGSYSNRPNPSGLIENKE